MRLSGQCSRRGVLVLWAGSPDSCLTHNFLLSWVQKAAATDVEWRLQQRSGMPKTKSKKKILMPPLVWRSPLHCRILPPVNDASVARGEGCARVTLMGKGQCLINMQFYSSCWEMWGQSKPRFYTAGSGKKKEVSSSPAEVTEQWASPALCSS